MWNWQTGKTVFWTKHPDSSHLQTANTALEGNCYQVPSKWFLLLTTITLDPAKPHCTLHHIPSIFAQSYFYQLAQMMLIESAKRRDILGNASPEDRDFPRAPSRLSSGNFSRCKIHDRGKSQGLKEMYFPMHPDSRQCRAILSALVGKY